MYYRETDVEGNPHHVVLYNDSYLAVYVRDNSLIQENCVCINHNNDDLPRIIQNDRNVR